MNIYLHELRALRGSTIMWVVGILLVMLFFLAIYPTFKDDMEFSREMIERMPDALKNAVNLSVGVFLSFIGFYAYIFTYIMLAGAVQGTSIGAGIVSRESRSKTTDFLFTRPITRRRIFIAKLAAALTIVAMVNLVLAIGSFTFARMFSGEEFSLTAFVLIGVAFLVVQLCFVAIGFVVAQLLRKVKSVSSVSLAVAFSLFVVGILQSLVDEEKFRYLSPFKYFDLNQIVTDKTYDMKFLAVAIAVIVGEFILSYILYTRRDTRSVE